MYCGNKVSAGGRCLKSPIKTHVVEKDKHCIFCGNKSTAGGSCLNTIKLMLTAKHAYTVAVEYLQAEGV